MKNLFIIAAGNSVRMGGIPKALCEINNVPNLINTIKINYNLFDTIYVISNNENLYKYVDSISNFIVDDLKKIVIFPIDSGKGCGDAILKTLLIQKQSILYNKNVICWGDTFFESSDIFNELLQSINNDTLVVPVKEEDNPYVWFSYDKDSLKSAFFSKKNQLTNRGYHDKSLFGFKSDNLLKYMLNFSKAIKREESYITNDYIFLDIVGYLYNENIKVKYYLTEYESYSYNTEEELKQIQLIIK